MSPPSTRLVPMKSHTVKVTSPSSGGSWEVTEDRGGSLCMWHSREGLQHWAGGPATLRKGRGELRPQRRKVHQSEANTFTATDWTSASTLYHSCLEAPIPAMAFEGQALARSYKMISP